MWVGIVNSRLAKSASERLLLASFCHTWNHRCMPQAWEQSCYWYWAHRQIPSSPLLHVFNQIIRGQNVLRMKKSLSEGRLLYQGEHKNKYTKGSKRKRPPCLQAACHSGPEHSYASSIIRSPLCKHFSKFFSQSAPPTLNLRSDLLP